MAKSNSATLQHKEHETLKTLRELKSLRAEKRARLARNDFFAFQRSVMKTPEGDYWEPAVIHREWDEFFGRHPRAVRWAPIEHGKSEQRSIAKTLWLIGQNVNIRQAIISETYGQSVKLLSAVAEYIEADEDYQRTFPNVRRKKGLPWTSSKIVVARDTISKDPTVLALGIGGSLLGARIDRAVLDDVLSFKNTFTEEQRKKTLDWILSTLIGRIVATGRIEVIGTAWHGEDAMHKLAKLEGYAHHKDRACDMTVVDGVLQADNPLWPEQWPAERLLRRRKEIGELEFARQMLNEALVEGMSRFKMEWWENAFALAEQHGFVMQDSNPEHLPAFTGGDLAIGKKSYHDLTAFATALYRHGHPAHKHLRHLANLTVGRWTSPQLIEIIECLHARYDSIVMPETNGAQDYIRQWLEETTDVKVRGFVTTGINKHDPEFGVESLAVELENGMWAIPRTDETEELAREAIYYDPTSHMGDRLAGWWLCREALRTYGRSRHSKPRAAPLDPSPGASIMEMDF